MRRIRNISLMTLILLMVAAVSATAQTGDPGGRVLIRAAKPYDALVARIQSLGGSVTYQFKYVDAIAAELPRNAQTALAPLVAAGNITKDEVIAMPQSVDVSRGR